ncbi:MAG: hypothetical protein QOE07_2141 [Acidimicrobiaceae bacterium]|jgi:hypothetical protein|nr:hypothetical protein [Acidimicrobiaceae bacterium]MDQ1376778.1 hypothetical protein [Acidimicrobiaceae bacterium]MDQ1413553.1 hypothetical protein [Acidimicrobiaceae bacterium]MDQ1440024.1 hypothetical protein [Acidimicrobiaceae bacterium]
MVRVSHPFHPWFGREFLFVRVTQTWGEDRVFFVDQDDELLSLPLGWTDAAPVDVFVEVAAGRCHFRVTDLTALVQLMAGLGDAGRECKDDSVSPVREILPSGRTRPTVTWQDPL